jgi:hypothetical protein
MKLHISFQYSEADYVRGAKFIANRHASDWTTNLIFFGSLLVGWILLYIFVLRHGCLLSVLELVYLVICLLISVPIAVVLLNYFMFRKSALRSMYHDSQLVREKQEIVFDEDEILWRSESLETRLKWDAILEAEESQEDVFLFTSPNQPMFFPKHAITSAELTLLRELIVNKLGAQAKLL